MTSQPLRQPMQMFANRLVEPPHGEAGDAHVASLSDRRNVIAVEAVGDTVDELAASRYVQALDALAGHGDDAVSLSLTVPFCAARCLCCARAVHAAKAAVVIDRYVDDLIDEMQNVADRGAGGRDVLQLHLGGGTANELGDLALLRLMSAIGSRWRVPADAELSADYDPRRASRSQLQLLRHLGFRRVNFGVLDLDPAVQRAIGRLQSASVVEDACAQARSCGVELITLGLMMGLPEQTEAGWRATLQTIVDIAPDRITVTPYRHRPWIAPTQFAIDAAALPEAHALRALAAQTAETLGAAGYCCIGPDHWVLDTDELATPCAAPRRSPIAYTLAPEAAVLALGPGAVGQVGRSMFRNVASLAPWRQAVAAGLFPVAQMFEADGAGDAVDGTAVASCPS